MEVQALEQFPLGCKTTYRKYTQDEAILIRQKAGGMFGFMVEYYQVQWYPGEFKEVKNDEGEVIQEAQHAGFSLLPRLPDEHVIRPQGFRAGGFEELRKTLIRVRKELPETNVAEWEEFAALASDSDDVCEYL